MKILHIVGGSSTNGAFKGAAILHKGLLKHNIKSKILSDTRISKNFKNDNNIISIKSNFKNIIFNKFFILIEKILKFIYLHSPRDSFTIGLFGFDITNFKAFKEADIIHIHWLSQGFINLKSLSKINKPVIWTMRDMWAFCGGPHYTMDFQKYENTKISRFLEKIKKKYYKKNFKFVAVSDWLKTKAEKSFVLKDHKVIKINNNIDFNNFTQIHKEEAKKILKINTKKNIILYGAQNPQSARKGWNYFVDSLKKLKKEKYFLLIFGNFWSEKKLNEVGIEYKSLGFINDNKKLNAIYASADIFVASSIQDAWPKTFAEAMACGTPVVCFENTSISEIVDHKINGYVVKNIDSQELSAGIEWLIEELKINKSLKASAILKASNYDTKKIALEYIRLYKRVIDTKFK